MVMRILIEEGSMKSSPPSLSRTVRVPLMLRELAEVG
jgi:hypothetical protein